MATVIRSALIPQRFPDRRDVALGAGIAEGDGLISFHDHLWLGRRKLAVATVRLRGTGLEGALDAASFRQLLRAALVVLGDPAAALNACREARRPADFDAAVVRLDMETGGVDTAVAGTARAEIVARGGRTARPRLASGDIVWLAVGGVPPPQSAELPVEGLDHLVRREIERVPAGCAAALLFRAAARSARSETFVVRNETGAIPPLLEEMAAFLARHSILPEEVEGVDVAVDEVLTNVIAYAFGDGIAHEILLALTIEDRCLVIEIRDDGAPFDPLGIPAADLTHDIDRRQVGGLGMHFVRAVMDEVSYKRSQGWNVLTLRKHLPADRRKPT